ncbi:MAG: hypothetical protein F6K09_15780, partial [Merismopedia sp. SIO2A8]|nr:hypothetical protein [Merismopedia sp. SIO2A8]
IGRAQGVTALFNRYHDPSTSIADQVQMDAMINHLLSVQMLHHHLIDIDVPKLAQDKAEALGWCQ